MNKRMNIIRLTWLSCRLDGNKRTEPENCKFCAIIVNLFSLQTLSFLCYLKVAENKYEGRFHFRSAKVEFPVSACRGPRLGLLPGLVGVRPVAALLPILVRQQTRGVEQLVVGHEPLLSGETLPLQGAQPGADALAVCHFQWAEGPDGPRDHGARLVHEDGAPQSREVIWPERCPVFSAPSDSPYFRMLSSREKFQFNHHIFNEGYHRHYTGSERQRHFGQRSFKTKAYYWRQPQCTSNGPRLKNTRLALKRVCQEIQLLVDSILFLSLRCNEHL